MFTFSGANLGVPLPTLYFEAASSSEPRRFSIPNFSRGTSYKVPAEGNVRILRDIDPNNDDETDLEPVLEFPAQPDEQTMLVFYREPSGQPTYTFLNDSPEIHPPGTVRAVNYGPTRLAVSVGNGGSSLRPGESVLLGAPALDADGRFVLDWAVERPNDEPYKGAGRRLRFPDENFRLLVAYTTEAKMGTRTVTDSDGDVVTNTVFVPETGREEEVEAVESYIIRYEPVVLRLYDRIEPEEPELTE